MASKDANSGSLFGVATGFVSKSSLGGEAQASGLGFGAGFGTTDVASIAAKNQAAVKP